MDEDSNIADINDIFQDLDTDLIEMLQRGQQANLFRDIPVEEHDNRINQLNRIFISRNNLQSRYQRSPHSHEYFYIYWAFDKIPIPCLNLYLGWMFLRTLELKQNLIRIFKFITFFIIKFFRMVPFIYLAYAYLKDLFLLVFHVSNLITFSDNFLKDAMAYMMVSNKSLVKRFDTNDTEVLYYMDDITETTFNEMSWGSIFKTILYNYVVRFISISCGSFTSKEGEFNYCKFDNNTLIFKFSDSILKSFPFLLHSNQLFSDSVIAKSFFAPLLKFFNFLTANDFRLIFLKFFTITIYLSFAIGGNLIALNVLALYSQWTIKTAKMYFTFYKELLSIVWQSLSNPII